MRIGIVGSEGAKFTPETEALAKWSIRGLLSLLAPGDTVISGKCHLGGIDIWAAEIGREMGFEVVEHAPAALNWDYGYKPRNLKIAQDSDKVVCITIKDFPPNYTGMRFPYCYHCKTGDHIKSGGCWTMKEAAKLGKETQLIVIGGEK